MAYNIEYDRKIQSVKQEQKELSWQTVVSITDVALLPLLTIKNLG